MPAIARAASRAAALALIVLPVLAFAGSSAAVPPPPMPAEPEPAPAPAAAIAGAGASSPLFPGGQPLSHASVGHLERLPQVASRVIEDRPVDVWLPPGYGRDPARRYPVIYMQDGQNVFDGALVVGPWGGWHVDAHIARLAASGAIREAIVVAVWSTARNRHSDYYPTKMLPALPEAVRVPFVRDGLAGRSRADDYLRYLVHELKPAIDRRYRTLPGRDDTFLMGSSMGGLISLYAMSEYPDVFGGAACLSTHWIGVAESGVAFPVAALDYLQRHLAPPAGHRLYMDHGDEGLDAHYGPVQQLMDRLAMEKGYGPGTWRSEVFTDADHNERAWNARLDEPLRFLLGKD